MPLSLSSSASAPRSSPWRSWAVRLGLWTGTAAATGAAAYYLMTAWPGPEDGRVDEATLGAPEGRAADAEQGGAEQGGAKALDEQVKARFDGAMDIANKTALPMALERVRASLERAADTAAITKELTALRLEQAANALDGDADDAALRVKQRNRKRDLWHELLVLSFARSAAGAWVGALAMLQTRVALAAFGRHEALNDGDGGDDAPNRRFLDAAVAHLEDVGVVRVVEASMAAARATLTGVALDAPVDAQTLRALLATAHAGAESRMMAELGGWAPCVLPPRAAGGDPPSEAERRCARALHSALFADALRAAAAVLALSTADGVVAGVAAPTPLAKLVAAVAAAPARCLVPANGAYDDAAGAREVHALAAAVFASA